ncbi:Flp pilus assembly protein TadG [Undibacterium sp. GrIS 1.8]|uniref:TadE/TadG family type IV pilus assembly protein n=1 Tax=Undibacterium sp. GrIS 1.8 TaxID=3143934 RepID=UPI00339104D0
MMQAPLSPQKGQSATEFLVIFPVLVLLVFGIIQLAFLYQGRAVLNHATLLAARAGALHNGNVGAMRNALSRGLAPMFASDASPAGYAVALGKAVEETALLSNMTNIEILNPTSSALDDFGRPRLDAVSGSELPNDTLNYRTTTAGTNSKISVQDANILHIRVTYCFRLIVPIIDRMLNAALNGSTPPSSAGGSGMSNPFGIGDTPLTTTCVNPLLKGPRIHIQSEAMVRMQSPFYQVNLSGSGSPGGPGTPPGSGTPGGPGSPPGTGTPGGPGTPDDPSDPGTPVDPGGACTGADCPVCGG